MEQSRHKVEMGTVSKTSDGNKAASVLRIIWSYLSQAPQAFEKYFCPVEKLQIECKIIHWIEKLFILMEMVDNDIFFVYDNLAKYIFCREKLQI